MSTATAQQCNGLNMYNGLMTWPAGICMNGMEDGDMTSLMVSCDVDGNGTMTVWDGPNCQGNTMWMSIEYWTEQQGANATMICNATDCEFAIVKTYDLNETNSNMTSCQSHDDCAIVGSFCYDGHCDVCEECHYCSDGVDGTCGSCGAGYPLYEGNCTAGFNQTGSWNMATTGFEDTTSWEYYSTVMAEENITTTTTTTTSTSAPGNVVQNFGWDATNLGLCQGDCDSDSDCLGSLICFQNNAYDIPPGCIASSNSSLNVTSYDYCYGSTTDAPTDAPTAATTTTTTGTETPVSSTTTTAIDSTTTTSTELCDAMNAVENWQETAIAVIDCVEYEWNGTSFYLGHVCQDGDFEIEYYLNANCSGSPLFTEDHWAKEGMCPEVTCNATNIYTPAPESESTTMEPTLAPVAAQCNGLKVWEEKNTSDPTLTYGHRTFPADVCMNMMEGANAMSQMVECDEYGVGVVLMWNASDCQGEYMMSESVEDMFDGEQIEMVCDAEDCDYALVKTYDWADSSESQDENDVDCGSNDLSNWQEVAFTMYDCEHSGYELQSETLGTFPVYVSNVCEDGGITMQYYSNPSCQSASLLESSHPQIEDHPAVLDGLCPEVTCVTTWSTTSTLEPTQDAATTMDYFIAVSFTLIVLLF